MVNKCIICNVRQVAGNSQLTFHSFPKNPNLRKKWIEICKLDNISVKPSYKICSNHFCENSYLPMFSKSKGLKPSAVPSFSIDSSSISPTIDDDVSQNSVIPHPVNETIEQTVYTSILLKPDLLCIPSSTSTEISSDSVTPCGLVEKSVDNNKPYELQIFDPSIPLKINSSLTTQSGSLNKLTPTARKKSYFHPRYIGDCTEDHFTTPGRRKKNLKFIKTKYFLLTKKIKCLKEQNRSLRKKIRALNSLLK